MKKLILAGVAFGALAIPAMAADLGSPAPPPGPVYKAPVMMPAYDWTGFYIGGLGSYSWSSSSTTTINTATGAALPPTSGSTSALHGGGQIGFDYMMPSRVVLGVVADVISGESNTTTTVDANGTFTNEGQTYESGTVRGKLGYALDHVLLYSTGGWSWSDGQATRTQVLGFTGNATAGTVESVKTFHDGWTVGAGVAFAVAENWNAFVQYRYTSTEPFTITYPIAQRSLSTTTTTNAVEFGVNYKLHWGPVGCRWNEPTC